MIHTTTREKLSGHTRRPNRWIAIAYAAMISSACDGGPIAPPPGGGPPPPPPGATYSISGTVSEITLSGSMPVEGVRVFEAYSAKSVMTDQSGLYRLSGLPARAASLSMSKEGYVTFLKAAAGADRLQGVARSDRHRTLS